MTCFGTRCSDTTPRGVWEAACQPTSRGRAGWGGDSTTRFVREVKGAEWLLRGLALGTTVFEEQAFAVSKANGSTILS